MISVFIGSSSEAKKAIGEKIAKELTAEGYTVYPWWNIFTAGRYTMTTLLEMTLKVDTAIFLFAADDNIKIRNHKGKTPRNNVLIEWGAFAARLGLHKTLIVLDPKAILPTDLQGLTVIKLEEKSTGEPIDEDKQVDEIINEFNTVINKIRHSPKEALIIRCDPDLVETQIQHSPPTRWVQRTLYYGLSGAKGWLEITNDEDYRASNSFRHNVKLFKKAATKLDVSTLVSFGPGSGNPDVPLVLKLKSHNEMINYVPIDISDALLYKAVETVGENVEVPFGILADFEDDKSFPFIVRELNQGARRPYLVSMLGNTFGNLDEGEINFLQHMEGLLEKNDHLLLEVCYVSPKWTPEKDKRATVDGWTLYNGLFTNAIARKTHEERTAIRQEFTNRLIVTCENSNEVPGSYCFSISDNKSKRPTPLLHVRRYNVTKLISWIRENFAFEYVSSRSGKGILYPEGWGMALLTFRKAGKNSPARHKS